MVGVNVFVGGRIRDVLIIGLLATCGWTFFVVPAGAQVQTASLEGRVTDEQDAVLVGASVTVSSPLLTCLAVAITDATGSYRVADLPVGVYTVTFELRGFSTLRHEGVTLRAGTARVLDAQLAVTSLSLHVDVVGVAPLLGSGIPRDRVPATTAVIDAEELETRHAPSLAAALHERLGPVALEDPTSSLFQPTLRFRGFTASPLLGLPQGVAVYQNGVRINEPFGDTVQFDLIPQFALQRVQLSAGAEPTFGLNALGGTLALQLKSGFDASGFRGEFSGGSFDRITGTAEVGGRAGPWAIYLGATRFDETGWRAASESDVTQAVADLAYRAARVDAGVSFIYADTMLNGNGPAPVELLEADRNAVFTFPDTTENRLGFTQGRFNYVVSPTWSVQVTGYYRDLDRRTLNGDEAQFVPCDVDALPAGAPLNTLCHVAGGDADGEVGGTAEPLVDVRSGRFITQGDAGGDGAFNRTTTRAEGYGSTLQATATTEVAGRDNVLILGVSADLADVTFASNSEIGTLTPERSVAGSGLLIGIFDEAPDDEFNTAIDAENQAYGLYFSNTLSLTDRFHVTAAGRYNEAQIDIGDRLGTALTGSHVFSRFNPAVGAAYSVSDRLSVFGRYSQSNRAPTAAELSCADPAEPCRVPNAFVSDPPLDQAVARSVEGGVRGQLFADSLADVAWSIAGYRTRVRDDILFVASPELIGTGFFQNAGDTQRVGLDFELTGRADRVGWYASYALVQATFESPLVLPGNQAVNDAASEDGELHVQPGDRLPGIPRHSFKGGVGYDLTDAWDVALETIVASSRVFYGDEGNDQPQLDGYGIVNLRSVYRVGGYVELFARVDNLFGQEYETFGILAELELDLEEAPDADDPRFVSPGAPRSAFAGVRVRF